MSATALLGAPETVAIANETSERVVRTMVFLIPPAALAVAGWLAWGGALRWQDLLVLAITYTLTGLGIEWVATHRKHHRFSDHPGDPHSPHVEQSPRWRGALRGLAHAHVGWMFRGKDMANPARYAKDLPADRDLRFISRTFPL